jgi:hypothetical protein
MELGQQPLLQLLQLQLPPVMALMVGKMTRHVTVMDIDLHLEVLEIDQGRVLQTLGIDVVKLARLVAAIAQYTAIMAMAVMIAMAVVEVREVVMPATASEPRSGPVGPQVPIARNQDKQPRDRDCWNATLRLVRE